MAKISIHAPARGGDRKYFHSLFTCFYFNPRPREGGRPPWRSSGPSRAHNFNPRPREGGDVICFSSVLCFLLFQSTPPRGGRLVELVLDPVHDPFQSTPPRGGRHESPRLIQRHFLFQSTPPRGGRRPARFLHRSSHTFQSTPPRGGRPISGSDGNLGDKFQSTPPRGGRPQWPRCTSSDTRHFNPRPREGGDIAHSLILPSLSDFNPRPREGGDSKDAQFYLRIFDKQVELLRFWGKMRGGCLRNPEKDRRFLGKSLANLPEISGHLDFAGA